LISDGSEALHLTRRLGGKIFAFVDADNVRESLNRAFKNLGLNQAETDQLPLIEYLLGAHDTNRYYVYSAIELGAQAPDWIKQIQSRSRFVFRSSLLTTKGGQRKQEGVDVKLAIEAIRCANKKIMDTALIFSDDGDLLPLVNSLVDEGITTAVVSFGNPERSDVAARLRDACDEYFFVGRRILKFIYSGHLRTAYSNMVHRSEIEELLDIAEFEFPELDLQIGRAPNGETRVFGKIRGETRYLVRGFVSAEAARIWIKLNGSAWAD